MEDAVLRTFATHSCKATVLSSLAKAGGDVSIRRQAGFHADPSDRSALEYSRDAQAPILQVVQRVYAAIREGLFEADTTRSGRWVGCSGLDDATRRLENPVQQGAQVSRGGPEEQGQHAEGSEGSEEEESLDSSVEEEEAQSSDDEREALVAAAHVAEASEFDDESLLSSGRVCCHVRSGVAHLIRSAEGPDEEGDLAIFQCGRICTANYRQAESLKFLCHKCSSCFK